MLGVGDEARAQAETDFAGEAKGRNGGRRPGAGRPPGARNALPAGTVRALKALKHRVPEKTPKLLANLAGEALAAVADVMRNGAKPGAFATLQAAAAIREEVCGPVPKRLEHSGPGGQTLVVQFSPIPEGDE